MTNQSAAESNYTADFAGVRDPEASWIARRRQAAGLPPPADDLVGLAFSGGGIRSATFNLGVLQALEAGGVLRGVDYLSSVSGGGYAASCYSWLRAKLHEGPSGCVFAAPLSDASGSVLDWLRGHGKYLISARGFSLWTLVASILAATFINLLVLGPVLLFAVYGLTLSWLPVEWPAWLTLPGAHIVHGHHGFWLLLAAGVLCLLAFPIVATLFAFAAGIPHLAGVHHIDRLRVLMGRLIIYGLALIAIGLIPIAAMLGEVLEHFFATHHAFSIGKHLSYLLPLSSGLGTMLLDRRASGGNRGRLTTVGLSLLVYGLLILCYHVAASTDLLHSAPSSAASTASRSMPIIALA